MSYNGSGTFNINSTGQPVVAGTVITASAFNALTTDLATGLTTAITKDGQTTTTARITFAQGLTSSLVTDSSSISTGSIITGGGVGIAKALYVGTTANVAGAVTLGGIATFSAQPIFSSLTASSAVATDASKGLVSVTNTGTGSNVLGTAPTIASANLTTALTLTGASGTNGQALTSAGSGNAPTWTTIAATPGGSTTQVQYNSSGAFAGSANMTFSGTALTLANDASISGLTVGKGGGALATNTAVGASALAATASGNYNSGFGYQALQALTSGNFNTACGQGSLAAMNTGSSNTALGQSALTGTTSGSSNVGIGKDALASNTTASSNTGMGYQALKANTTAGDNTAVGSQCMTSNTTGSANTAMGVTAFLDSTTGSNNVAIGKDALRANTTASNNTAVGYQAGTAITTSGDNTCVGYTAGNNITTGATNTCVGRNAIPSGATTSNETVVGGGFPFQGKGANTGYFGGSSGAYNQANSAVWTTTSDRRLKKNIVDNTDGLSKITSVRVRNFEYRVEEEITELPTSTAIKKDGVQLGVIAQELQAVLPDCVKQESTGVLSVNSENLTWYMINAIKELKAELDTVKAELATLKG